MRRGYAWLDTDSRDSLHEAAGSSLHYKKEKVLSNLSGRDHIAPEMDR